MCGIFGFLSQRELPVSSLLEGMKRLEYRGYDSAGIALLREGEKKFKTIKTIGNVSSLQELLSMPLGPLRMGLGHTRWATHGQVSEKNAMPLVSQNGSLCLAMNGILENDCEIRSQLEKKSLKFITENDAETILEFISNRLGSRLLTVDLLLQELESALESLEGRFALAIFHKEFPANVFLYDRGRSLVVAYNQESFWFSSDEVAFPSQIHEVHHLNASRVYCGRLGHLSNLENGRQVTVDQSLGDSRSHFSKTSNREDSDDTSATMKEILEQETVLSKAADAVLLHEKDLKNVFDSKKRIYIIGCGSAFYASEIGAQFLQKNTLIPSQAVIASEFVSQRPPLGGDALVIALSQSGETADTLVALEYAKLQGSPIVSICNRAGSALTRVSDVSLLLNVGPEIGVASTKAFTGMLVQLVFLSLIVGQANDQASVQDIDSYRNELMELPTKIGAMLQKRGEITRLARRLRQKRNFLFIGRQCSLYLSEEGALKLRELSYRHASGFGGGELKHGTLALIEQQYPVFAIAPNDQSIGKMRQSIQEIKARGGKVFGILSEGDEVTQNLCDTYFCVPRTLEMFIPILMVIPLQLFAHYVAKSLGRNIDRPRNLAKSVTVE